MLQCQASIVIPLPVGCMILWRWVLPLKVHHSALKEVNIICLLELLTRIKCDIVWDMVSGWGMDINDRIMRICYRERLLVHPGHLASLALK